MRNIVVFTLFMALSMSSHAFTKRISETYALGDGESKTTAREAILEKIRQKAADSAGVYIQSDKSINSKGFSESIKSISASIVKFKNQKEAFDVKNGTILMTVTSTVEIDDSVLKDRIKAIQTDQKKAKLIRKLDDDNKALHARLTKLEKALKNKQLSTKQIADILNEKARINGSIVKNNQSAEQVFKRGSLFALANMTANKDKELYQQWRTKWKNFFEDLNLKITPKVLSIKPSGSGYIARIGVQFPKNMIETAKKVFCGYGNCRGTKLSNKNERHIDDIIALVDVAQNHSVILKAGIPGRTNEIKLAGSYESGFFSHDPYQYVNEINMNDFEARLRSDGYTKYFAAIKNKETHSTKDLHIDWDKDLIVFTLHLSKKEAESAEKVVASIIVS